MASACTHGHRNTPQTWRHHSHLCPRTQTPTGSCQQVHTPAPARRLTRIQSHSPKRRVPLTYLFDALTLSKTTAGWAHSCCCPPVPGTHAGSGPAPASVHFSELSAGPHCPGQEGESRGSAQPGVHSCPLPRVGRSPPPMRGSCRTPSSAALFWDWVSFPLPAFPLESMRGCCRTAFVPLLAAFPPGLLTEIFICLGI